MQANSISYQMSKPLLHKWIIGGVVSAASRFTPVPLVDDLIETRALRYVVQKTLDNANLKLSKEAATPLYDYSGSIITRIAKKAARLPLRLVTFPFRKALRLVTSIRGIPLDLLYAVLLGRSLDRCIEQGIYVGLSDEKAQKQVSTSIRVSFNEVISNADLQVLSYLLPQAWENSLSWFEKFKDSILDKLNKNKEDIASAPEIDTLSEQFEKSEVKSFMQEFDRKFDRALTKNLNLAN